MENLSANYLRELNYYTQEKIMDLFKISPEEFKELSEELIEKKMLIKKNEMFQMNFVGFISFKNRLAFVFPKYLNSVNNQIVRQFISLFKEYSSRENLKEEEIETFGDLLEEKNFNLISMIFFLFEDYIEYGVYEEEYNISVLDGEGEINWQQTVEELYPIHIQNQSIYLNIFNTVIKMDENHTITNIHKYVLNQCIEYFKETGLNNFFDYQLELFDLDKNNINSKEFMLNKIQNELSTQYNDRKVQLLKVLYNFLVNEGSFDSKGTLSIYGTKSFWVVWEKVCSFNFNNLYTQIAKEEIIDKPMWKIPGNAEGKPTDHTFIPDIITILQKEKEMLLTILDAKYFNIKFDGKKVRSAPMLEDISKQYYYEMALKKYMKEKKYKLFTNAFLLPDEGDTAYSLGKVYLRFFQEIPLNDIQLIKLPSKVLYENYINKKQLTENEIYKIICLK